MTTDYLTMNENLSGGSYGLSYQAISPGLTLSFMDERNTGVSTPWNNGQTIETTASMGTFNIDLTHSIHDTVKIDSTYGCVAITDFSARNGDHLVLPSGSYANGQAALAALHPINAHIDLLALPGQVGCVNLINPGNLTASSFTIAPAHTAIA